jgi:hypothetical protein
VFFLHTTKLGFSSTPTSTNFSRITLSSSSVECKEEENGKQKTIRARNKKEGKLT